MLPMTTYGGQNIIVQGPLVDKPNESKRDSEYISSRGRYAVMNFHYRQFETLVMLLMKI